MHVHLDLRISVNAWNAIKFLLFEFLISLVFARLWDRSIRSRTHLIIRNGNVAKVFASGIGRLTPAQLNVCKSRAKYPFGFSSTTASKLLLLLVNLLLLASLLVAEYGSSSTFVFRSTEANVTTVATHPEQGHWYTLVRNILQKNTSLSTLYPLKLTAGDYSYETHRVSIQMYKRVRNASSNSFLLAKSVPLEVRLCGMLFTSCNKSLSDESQNRTFRVYQVNNLTLFKENVKSPNSIETDIFISTAIKEIGWIDSAKTKFTSLHRPKTPENVACTFKEITPTFDASTYHPLHCAMDVGNFTNIFTYKVQEDVHDVLFDADPKFKNPTGVAYVVGEIYEDSLFGVQKQFIPSNIVALIQTLHYQQILQNYVDKNLLRVLKEQNVWALLGMVSGNSNIEEVSIQTKEETATINELFLAGVGMIVFVCALLLVLNCAEGWDDKSMYTIPVSDADLLLHVRKLEEVGRRTVTGDSRWPELFKRRDAEELEYLSFTGDPLSA